jgi:hypothetical protein
VLVAIQIVTVSDEIVLCGYRFTYSTAMKEYCAKLYEARSEGTTASHLLAIVDLVKPFYFAGSSDPDPFPPPSAQQPMESLVLPKGDYLLTDPKSQEAIDFTLQSTIRIDHKKIYIEQYDFQHGVILAYLPIRRNGVDLTRLPQLPSAQARLLREQYISAFVREQRDNTYFSHLWDRFVAYNPLSIEDIVGYLDGGEEVCFFWDSYPGMSPLLHRLGQEHVFKLPLKELLHHYELKNIPDDVYLFDESLTWTVALTHEPHNEHDWKCLSIGNWR